MQILCKSFTFLLIEPRSADIYCINLIFVDLTIAFNPLPLFLQEEMAPEHSLQATLQKRG